MKLPVTRYYGSKRKLVEKIWNTLEENNLHFNSVLDLFGGTGIFSYYAKVKNKRVIYNDIFEFNCCIAKALMGTPQGIFTEEIALGLLERKRNVNYQDIIERNYQGIYYTNEENRTIDTVVQNINLLDDIIQPSAYYLLFQACLIKRPFNLFHRKNLNLRTNYTNSNFGNKVTWEKGFEELFKLFTKELNQFQFSHIDNIVFPTIQH